MLAGAKRKLEQDLQAMQADMDDAITELKNTEEKAKKAAGDAANLAEELRREQEHAIHVDRLRKQLEVTVAELQGRLEEAEAAALKELAFQAEEDRKNMERMQDLVEKLQAKIKTYK